MILIKYFIIFIIRFLFTKLIFKFILLIKTNIIFRILKIREFDLYNRTKSKLRLYLI